MISLATGKSTPTKEANIKEIGGNNMIEEVSVISKANTRASKSRTGFFTPKTRLVFT